MKILLVDDHPLFLEGLVNLLEARGFHVVATAANGEEALKKTEDFQPDVILMDIQMKPLSGVETTRLIKARYPQVHIIMLTASETEIDLLAAVKSGASGYLLKSLDAQELYDMLSRYEQGEIPVTPILASKLLEEFKQEELASCMLEKADETEEREENIPRLSKRQKDVLVLVAKGIKYKEIAQTLGVTERTVKYYMDMILRKLHVENRSQAIRYAIEKGVVE